MQQSNSQTIAHSTASPPSPQSKSSKQMDPHQSSETQDEALLRHLRLQIEYYFSPQNLSRDTFLNSILNSRDHFGAVPVATISSFPKVKEIYASWLAGRFVPAFSAAPANPLTVGAAIRGSDIVKISADGHWLMPACYPSTDKTGSHVTSPTISPTSFDSGHSQASLAGPNNVNAYVGPEHVVEHHQPVAFSNAYPSGTANVIMVPYSVSVPSDPSAPAIHEEMKQMPHGPVFGAPYAHAYSPYANGPYPMGMVNNHQMQFAGHPYMDGTPMPPSPAPVPPHSPSKTQGMQAHSSSPGWTSHMVGHSPSPGHNNSYGPPNQYCHLHREQQEYAPHPGRFAYMNHQHTTQPSHYPRLDQENMVNGALVPHPPIFVDMSNPDSVSQYDGASLTNEQLHHYQQHRHFHQQHQGKYAAPSKSHRNQINMDHSHHSNGSYSSSRGRNPRHNKMKSTQRDYAGPSQRGRKSYNTKAKKIIDSYGTVNEDDDLQRWNDSYNSANSAWYDSEGKAVEEYAKRHMDCDQCHGAGSYGGRRNTQAHHSFVQTKKGRPESFPEMTAPTRLQDPQPETQKAEVAHVITAPSVQTPKRGKPSSIKALGGKDPQTLSHEGHEGNGDSNADTMQSVQTPERAKPSFSKALAGKNSQTVHPDGNADSPVVPGTSQGSTKTSTSSGTGNAVTENSVGDTNDATAASPAAVAPESQKAKSSPVRRINKKSFGNKARASVITMSATDEGDVSVGDIRSIEHHLKSQRRVPPERKHRGTSVARTPNVDAAAVEDSSLTNNSGCVDPDAKSCAEDGEELSALQDLSLQPHKKKFYSRGHYAKKSFKKHQLTSPPEELSASTKVEPETCGERIHLDSGGQGELPRKGTASDQQSKNHED